jgi:acyl-CoA synthetase (NDP forming)
MTDDDAREAVRELHLAPLLLGYRGQPGVDIPAIEDLILRVGTLADEVPELAELDLNPVMVGADGVVVVDIKARVAPVRADEELLRDPLVRSLR